MLYYSIPPPDRMCLPPGMAMPLPGGLPGAPSPGQPMPYPRQPLPGLVPMMHPFQAPRPVPSRRTVTPHTPQPPAMLTPPLLTGLVFSQEDLDMVLYGYARNKTSEQLPGHALSGLRLGDLSHGELHSSMYRPF